MWLAPPHPSAHLLSSPVRSDIVNDSACAESVANTFEKIMPQCMNYMGGFYYYDAMVAYSNENFLVPSNITENYSLLEKWNIKNITGDADNVRSITSLIHELLTETVQKAASTARRFATGIMDSGITFPKVYSLAQCTPDLSAGDCLACLHRIFDMMNSTMSMRMGAQIHVVRCSFRYEAYVFYLGEPMVRLGPSGAAAPLPAPMVPTKEKHKKEEVNPPGLHFCERCFGYDD